MNEQEEKPHFYGRRSGRRLRKAKAALMENFLPQVKLDPQNPLSFPIEHSKVYLEIGFGDGDHLAGHSAKHRDICYIGAEVFKNGIANLLSLITGIKQNDEVTDDIKLLPERTDNVRIWDDDIRLLFPLIKDNSIDRVFLLFPDPWPKKRHEARRFINPGNLKILARILKPGGVLRVATDHIIYKIWTLRQLHESPDFRWTAACGKDWKFEPSDWEPTKYQRKAIREGRRPVFLDFVRK
ncbi:MAG: tRNA (guanosine(46)-N7)-methyltransferase TrmB [Alphaproteobacteria bacterium]|nr:tRNA (guanosine(46)-N7)-methyltransferase TrmB [Alphaproteobacteria bacterium]